MSRTLATAAAVALSVALEVTGPPRPFLFSLRLPLAVLVIGALWTDAPWRTDPSRRGKVARSRQSVPMATPPLILTLTAGVAAATAKLVWVSPAMACALLSAVSAACCLTVGLLVAGEHGGPRGLRGPQGPGGLIGPRRAAAPP